MALEVFEFNVENKAMIPERAIIYSRPGYGKTRLALSLPDNDKWGDILYYAADPGSEYLSSVLPKYINHSDGSRRVHIIRADATSPIVNFQEFCIRDWNKTEGFEKVRTLVVDTFTRVGFSSIQWTANSGAASAEKHFKVGDTAVVIPNRGDYMGIASLCRGYIDTIFKAQRDMNIIFLMHEDPNVIEGVGVQIGPSFPGRQMAEELPANFPTVIHLDRKQISVPNAPPKTVVVAQTNSPGSYIAKLRENGSGGNPIPEVILDVDPINFWNAYEHAMGTQRSESTEIVAVR